MAAEPFHASIVRESSGGCKSLRGERYGARSCECAGEPREYREVGMKPDALKAADAKRGEAVFVLEPAEFALDCGAAGVEDVPALRLSRQKEIPERGVRRRVNWGNASPIDTATRPAKRRGRFARGS